MITYSWSKGASVQMDSQMKSINTKMFKKVVTGSVSKFSKLLSGVSRARFLHKLLKCGSRHQ
jgi:hypothetical protein